MIDEAKWERVTSPSDPRRCQAMAMKNEQCFYVAVPGSDFCPRHNINGQKKEERAKANRYRFQLYGERIAQLEGDEQIFNLRAELSVLRMILEEIVNACKGANDVIQYSGRINDTIMKIRDLTKTCKQIETQLGRMLEADKLIQVGQRIVDIVSEYIKDADILDAVAEKISVAIKDVIVPVA